MAAVPLPSADELEAVFHAALQAGDVAGVEAALLVMCRVDPARVVDLYDALDVALALARGGRS